MKTIVFQPNETGFQEHFNMVDTSNPFLLSGIIVVEDDAVAGSLCVYHNPEIVYQGMPALLLGNFSCINAPAVADLLFTQAGTIGRTLGKSFLIGPINGSIWYDYRLPISGKEPLFYGDMVQPLYYADLFCLHGFQSIHRYHAYSSALPAISNDPISLPDQVVLRHVATDSFETELSGLYDLCHQAFKRIPFFTAVDRDFFVRKYTQLLPLISQKLSLIAAIDGKPVAFLFAYQDIQQPQTLVIKTAAKHPDYHLPGLMTNIARTLLVHIAGMGHTKAIHAFMHEENRSLLRSREFGGTILRSYALLGKNISH